MIKHRRDYKKIARDMTVNGFFSEYLPPCFKLSEKVLQYIPKENCDVIAPCSFTMSWYNSRNARRTIFIPEIDSYLVAQNYMRENGIIQELIELSEQSHFSFSPILDENNEITSHEEHYMGHVFGEERHIPSKYIANVIKKIKRSAGAKQILKLDISNCFSSFYMHMIPAIVLGVEGAEIEYRKNSRMQK